MSITLKQLENLSNKGLNDEIDWENVFANTPQLSEEFMKNYIPEFDLSKVDCSNVKVIP